MARDRNHHESNHSFADGSPRTRIPEEHWEAAHPALGRRAGYLWGDKIQFVPTVDIGDHIGFASPELRRLSIGPIVNIDAATRAAFLDEGEASEEASG